jgi:hypothetical protein
MKVPFMARYAHEGHLHHPGRRPAHRVWLLQVRPHSTGPGLVAVTVLLGQRDYSSR